MVKHFVKSIIVKCKFVIFSYMLCYLSGKSVTFIADELGIAKSTLYNWIKKFKPVAEEKILLPKILIILNKEQIVNLI